MKDKVFKVKDVVRLKESPLDYCEVIGIREYEGQGPVYLVWGINNSKSGPVGADQLELAIPYWPENAKLPYKTL